jgi:hypothetical protein
VSLNPLDAAFTLGSILVERIWPDPTKQAAELLKLEELRQKGDLSKLNAHVQGIQGQLAINAEEAKHPSIFVAGWRPFVGWVGGFSLAYAAILEPFLRFAASIMGYTGVFPVVDTSITVTVLLGMLGIGAQRSFDKLKGNNTNRVQ